MGCISSKLLTKSGSFSETVSQTFQRKSNVLEELLNSGSSRSNADQQFLALLCSTNTTTNLKPINSEPNRQEQTQFSGNPDQFQSPGQTEIETINAWELLAGLEEENEEQTDDTHEVKDAERIAEEIRDGNSKGADTGKARSFRTVEDLNIILAFSESEDSSKSATEDSSSSGDTRSSSDSIGTKRKARARELARLELPVFEFAKGSSLRDWVLKGGQIFSPGSYVTPKFGSSVQEKGDVNNAKIEDGGCVFDSDMLAQFEKAIEEMRKEEENVLKEIVRRLEENEEQQKPVMSIGKDFIELNCQGSNGFGMKTVLV